MASFLDRARGFATLCGLVLRAARLRAPARSLQQRLGDIPLAGAPVAAPVVIRWNSHAVPFVTARSDADLAVGLGVVHAHLRRAQLEVMLRLAQGRVSEMIGPLGLDIDIALRTIDITRAVPGMIEMLPQASRAWAEAFLGGINHVVARAPALPVEAELFGFDRTPWTLHDLFSLARLAAIDITWQLSFKLLKLRETMPRAEWLALWPTLLDTATLPHEPAFAPLAAAAATTTRGSNSAAIGGSRTLSGSAMIASDPHVGLQLPSVWLACGMAAPGINAAGLMIPGIPSIAIGRNENIAWGATNLHAASSVFCEPPAGPPPVLRDIIIGLRGGAVRHATVRDSAHGPILADARFFGLKKPVALRWVGHLPSDELTPMLAVNRAGNFAEFQQALGAYAVQGYSFTYADKAGQVGILRAAHVPRRHAAPADIVEPAELFDDIVSLAPHTGSFGPPENFVVSANENPKTFLHTSFFLAPPDRAARQAALLDRTGIALADLAALQRDVFTPSTLSLRDALAARAQAMDVRLPPEILNWDGGYGMDSIGALGYEVLLAETARGAIGRKTMARLLISLVQRELIGNRLLATADTRLGPALRRASAEAARAMAHTGGWGRAHRLTLAHPLALLPWIGRKFGSITLGLPGSNDTLYKTAHNPVRGGWRRGRHTVTFGTSARHVAELNDPDSNFLVILGGQDGWVGSENATDQIALWQAGTFMRLPLQAATIEAEFQFVTTLVRDAGKAE